MQSAGGLPAIDPTRYVLLEEIGTGGMASVFLGRCAETDDSDRVVAIKRLHPHLARDNKFVAMLLDEAAIASRIHHPNVVGILDVVAVRGEFCIVMEYVHGQVLSQLMARCADRAERVPLPIAIRVVLDLLGGLHAAHQAIDDEGQSLHIVHRDVSPQNVIVGVDGCARVLDFGVAKAARRMQSTRTGELKGKLSYMAPEQLTRSTVDHRADIYAASVILWELMVGRKLFSADNEGLVITQALAGEIEPPSELVEGVPASLDDIVLRGVHKNPAERFASAEEMIGVLEACVQPAPATQVGAWVQALAAEELRAREFIVQRKEGQSVPALPSSVASVPAKKNRRRWLPIAVAAAVIVTLAGTAAALRSSRATEVPSSMIAPSGLPTPGPQPMTSTSELETPGPQQTSVPADSVTPPSAKPAPKESTHTRTTPLPTKPNCSPPYFIDSQGIRRVRRECLPGATAK